MIGVAGMVAENLWKAGNDPDRMDDIYDLLDDPNCMSESDWRNGGLDCGAGLTETQQHEIESVIDCCAGHCGQNFSHRPEISSSSRVTSTATADSQTDLDGTF